MLKPQYDGRSLARACALGAMLTIPWGLLASGQQQAGKFDKKFETTAAPRITLHNLSGQVIITGWDKREVHVIYVLPSPNLAVEMRRLPGAGPADKIHFTTYLVNRSAPDGAVNYTLQVPVGSSLEIRNPQGGVKVNSIQGDASIDSLGGSIDASDMAGHLSVRSVGGSIWVTRSSGRVEAYSINGDLHFVDPSSSKLRGSTTSGKIIYEGGFVSGGDYVLSDYSGDMEIICPPTASFELNAKTVRGKLENQFPLQQKSRPNFPNANSIFGTHSTGEATLEVTSFSGSIRIRQR